MLLYKIFILIENADEKPFSLYTQIDTDVIDGLFDDSYTSFNEACMDIVVKLMLNCDRTHRITIEDFNTSDVKKLRLDYNNGKLLEK